MTKRESAIQAGKLGCIKLRELAIERYYKNPNYCLQCGKIIDVADGVAPCITKEEFNKASKGKKLPAKVKKKGK